MKQEILTIQENIKLAEGVYRMKLAGDISAITAPGQFVNIKLDGHFLRRPISVNDISENELTIIYKILGEGTREMSQYEVGRELDVLTGLGNGYSIELMKEEVPSRATIALIGGGVGIPPLYLLAKKLIASGEKVHVVLGFNSSCDVFYEKEFLALGAEVSVATADGSYGIKGFVTDILPSDYSYFFTCGPEPMLKAVYKATTTPGQMSFEERMGCGFGACMGCSCKTVTGYKRICKEGPVLRKEEVLW
ncbi:MAG: dihydroorotate dehydrogenase electron transfer subunit [Clostridiales bacterium]|jgi:dihydroorotate dehydrogenase electron transfer subunit|nr:dihydroorotate dehydrogenase electron transfer subunit [Clostridiales bacterium]